MSSKMYVGIGENMRKCVLDPLRNLASEIDNGLRTLEKNLADASTSFPSAEPEHVTEAAGSMDEALQLLKKIGAKTATMKLNVTDIAEDLGAMQTEALTAFETMDEDFSRMEKMLEPFGYKPFSAPKHVSINVIDCSGSMVETVSSESNPSIENSSYSLFNTPIEMKDPFEEEEENVPGLDGSYTYVESTPMIFKKSNKSQITQQQSLISSDEGSVNCAGPAAGNNLFSCQRSVSVTTPVIKKSPLRVATLTEQAKPIIRPKKVIYSKEVYEILGIEPPPEFYTQQCSN